MQSSFRIFRAVSVSILFTLVVSSCARSPWKRSLVSSADGVAIFRERRFDDNGEEARLGYRHPINLSPEQIGHVLGALSYTRTGWLSDTTAQTIAPEVVDNLSTQVSKGLEDLSPDERLRFLAVSEQGTLFLNRHVGTSAVVFAPNNDEVTVAFDLVDDTVVADGGNPESVRFYDDPMELSDPGFRLHVPEPLIGDRDSAKPAPPPNRFTFNTGNIASLPDVPAPAPAAVTKTVDEPAVTAKPIESPKPVTRTDSDAPTFDLAYKGFSVIAYLGKYYGLAASEGKFDPAKLEAGTYKTLFERDSVDDVIASIDAIVESVKGR